MRRAVPALIAISLTASLLHAAGPRFWRIEGTAEFLKGELHHLSVDSEARLRLGPEMRSVFDPELPNAWSVARDRKGALYVGTGNDGRVFRVEGEEGEVLFDAEELEVYAVAVSPRGEVYAATSPGGAVYAIDARGSSRSFFDPEETYIWDLAFDAAGRLIVATGAEGRIHRVAPDGTAEVLLESAETHVLSLALDDEGRIFAGSSPEGIVYRIGTDGDVFVLVDSPFREIKALVVDGHHGVYAAAVNGGPEAPTPPAPAPAPPAPAPVAPVAQVTVTETFTVAPPAATPPPTASTAPAKGGVSAVPKGAVLRIDDGGAVETLWSSGQDIPHALAGSGDGVLVGTGDGAKLYRVERDGRWALLATYPARQVTGIVAADQQTALVTSNPARVVALTGKTASEGTFVSEVKDAETVAAWGRLEWEGSAPAAASIRLETRSGNSSNPDSTWSDWKAVSSSGGSAAIGSDGARFLQLRLTLSDGEGATPTVEALSVAYLQRNRRPQVTSITIHPPGQVFQKPISVSGEPEILGLDPDPVEQQRSERSTTPAASPTTFGRKLLKRGLRTFGWSADDPNGDLLTYDVEYRAVGDEHWRPLRTELAEPVLTWDTSAVPDGRYLVRVTASDAPDNPPSLALTGHKDSASFDVDNAPPTLSASLVASARRPAAIRAVARDAGTPIQRLEVSVDAGRWQEVYPTDGINDSREETYEFPVPTNGGAAPRVVVLRVADRLGNVATGRVDVP